MKTSFAILALLGLVATDVDALSLERRHHRHVPGVTFVMDAGMDGEDKKIAETIAKKRLMRPRLSWSLPRKSNWKNLRTRSRKKKDLKS